MKANVLGLKQKSVNHTTGGCFRTERGRKEINALTVPENPRCQAALMTGADSIIPFLVPLHRGFDGLCAALLPSPL